MTSIKRQFVVFSGLMFAALAVGGWWSTSRLQDAARAEDAVTQANEAVRSHLLATFYNEEMRVLIHSAAALYDFSQDERRGLEGSLKAYAEGIEKVASSYAERARAEVQKNLLRNLPQKVIESLRLQQSLMQAYSDMAQEAFQNLPRDKTMVVHLYGRLNDIRARIGQIRRQISEALEEHRRDAALTREAALDAHKWALSAGLGLIVVLVTALLAIIWFQLTQFVAWVKRSVVDFTERRPFDRTVKIRELAVVSSFFDELQKQRAELEEADAQTKRLTEAREKRIRQREEAVAIFQKEIAAVAEALADGASGLHISAHELDRATIESGFSLSHLAAGVEAADASAAAVAGACTEMASASQSLSENLQSTFTLVANADLISKSTNDQVTALEAGAMQISGVVAFIHDVADQTNLLALNATIEAARAGEAGRGFAVVATEVKDLAARSSEATRSIAALITQIQSTCSKTASDIRDLSSKVAAAESRAHEMSAALQQQMTAVSSLAHIAESSSRQTTEVRSSLSDIERKIALTSQIGKLVAETSQQVVGANDGIKTALQNFVGRMATP